jgi:hypothetical protein
MIGRALAGFLCCLPLIGLSSCRPTSAPQGAPLRAGPYPECRDIIQYVRSKTGDPEARVLHWGPRQQQNEEGGPPENASVSIEAQYQATIGNVSNGHWRQTFRVTGRRVEEETPCLADEEKPR